MRKSINRDEAAIISPSLFLQINPRPVDGGWETWSIWILLPETLGRGRPRSRTTRTWSMRAIDSLIWGHSRIFLLKRLEVILYLSTFDRDMGNFFTVNQFVSIIPNCPTGDNYELEVFQRWARVNFDPSINEAFVEILLQKNIIRFYISLARKQSNKQWYVFSDW